MQIIFQYVEYREALKEWFLASKSRNKSYSYRSMATSLGLNSGSLSRIIKGERKLPLEQADRFADLLRLDAAGKAYFFLLVQFDHEADSALRRDLYRQIITARMQRKRPVTPLQFDYFSQWYHTAIRELLRIEGALNAEQIKALLHPSPSLPAVRKSLATLVELGMILQENACYRVVESLLTTDEAWREAAVQEYQSQMMQLGIEALDRIDWRERDLSTVTIALAEADLPRAREILKTSREELLQLEEQSSDHTRVYQCNLQFFPLTKPLE